MSTNKNFTTNVFDTREYGSGDGDILQMEFENTLEMLDDEQTRDCAEIRGTLGLWDGKHDIEPVCENTVGEAVKRCIRDGDDFIITKNEFGELEIIAIHHDGRNHFTVKY